MSLEDPSPAVAKVDASIEVVPPEQDSLKRMFQFAVHIPHDSKCDHAMVKTARAYHEEVDAHAQQQHVAFAAEDVLRGVDHSHHGIVLKPYPWDSLQIGITAPPPEAKRSTLHMMRTYVHDGRDIIYPWGGQRVCIEMVKGLMVVVVVDCTTARSFIGDVDHHLADARHTLLQDCPAYSMATGDFLFVPLGSLPLFMSYSKDAKGKLDVPKRRKGTLRTADDYASYIVHVCFSSLDEDEPEELKQYALARYVAGYPSIPHVIRNGAEAATWKAKMEGGTD